jgi:hypothetical protein
LDGHVGPVGVGGIDDADGAYADIMHGMLRILGRALPRRANSSASHGEKSIFGAWHCAIFSTISVFHILQLIETDIYRSTGFSKCSGYPCQQGECYYDQGDCDNESRFHIKMVACEIWNNQEKYVRKFRQMALMFFGDIYVPLPGRLPSGFS